VIPSSNDTEIENCGPIKGVYRQVIKQWRLFESLNLLSPFFINPGPFRWKKGVSTFFKRPFGKQLNGSLNAKLLF